MPNFNFADTKPGILNIKLSQNNSEHNQVRVEFIYNNKTDPQSITDHLQDLGLTAKLLTVNGRAVSPGLYLSNKIVLPYSLL